MRLRSRANNVEYEVTTEAGDGEYFRIYAKSIDGEDSFVRRYTNITHFLRDWEDAD